jgi:hypothetical protein
MIKYVVISPNQAETLTIEANSYEINETGFLSFIKGTYSCNPFMSINPSHWAVVMEAEDEL